MEVNPELINGLTKEIITILASVKEKINDDSDLIWTSYETPLELRDEIDRCINHLQQNHKQILEEINFHFTPTGTFQEHSMSNGWSEEYSMLAERFDKTYNLLKKNSRSF
jgi:hypothetical protein